MATSTTNGCGQKRAPTQLHFAVFCLVCALGCGQKRAPTQLHCAEAQAQQDRKLWPEESAHSVTLGAEVHHIVPRLWPEESAHSVTLIQQNRQFTQQLWPEESAHSVTLNALP